MKKNYIYLIHSKIENILDPLMKNLVQTFLSYIEIHEASDLNELLSKYYGKGEGGLEECDLSKT